MSKFVIIKDNQEKFLIVNIFVFSFSFFYMIQEIVKLPKNIWIIFSFILSLILISGVKFHKRKDFKFYSFPISGVSIVILFIFIWYEKIFGELDIGSIMFHLELGFEMPFIPDVISKAILSAIKLSLICFLLLFALSYLIARDRRFLWGDRVMALPILLLTPLFPYFYGLYAYGDVNDVLIDYYVQPPDGPGLLKKNRKNIILLYAESTERTFADLVEGPEIFRGMMNVAGQGLHVKGIEQVANTGWTIAGIVSTQCGVPLQPLGKIKTNGLDVDKLFLPGAVCVSDLAKENGYHTEFLKGGDLAFAGTDRFLSQHKYQVSGALKQYKDTVGNYLNDWGLYDDTLFQIAEERIYQLHYAKKPFLMTLLTVGGHFPDGYPSQSCIDNFGPPKIEGILFAAQCTGYLIEGFIDRLKQTGILKDTIIIVMSDHFVMQNSVLDRLQQHDRMNYFTILSDEFEPSIINKKTSMLDVYPTILELMGFDIPSGKAGLGVSIFSKNPSLLDSLGEDALNRYIKYDRALTRGLWFTEKHSLN